ncbi:hypothetical protein [Micromonospora sp. AKA38]|uniref:hypothetical protein n=1 Tax=Micromonospora sp. AKA38 TaxID=2733861 RepID=UPI0022C6B65F|nr:hypothetical protein [Micromonospora sp. AKA38]GHJ14245.1 hypothetical protein TPA0908_22400 [Micromonospora sp. AKA38]
MPAKRNPKKSRKPSSSPLGLTPTDLDALTVSPSTPVTLSVSTPGSASAGPVSAGSAPVGSEPAGSTSARSAPKAGPSAGRDARLAGRSQRAGQNRFYAFRRS